MAVVSVNKLYTGRGAVDTFTRQRSYRETWEVIVDSINDDEDIVAGASGIPRLGQPHSKFAYALCVEVAANQSEDSPYIWHVDIKFDSNLPLANGIGPDGSLQNPADIPENPLARPATWQITFQKTTEAGTRWYKVDASGNTVETTLTAIRNSAKLPFDPPPAIEVSRPVLRVTKNVASVTLSYLLQLQDAVNRTTWKGLPPRTARVDGVSASNKFENSVAFVELSLEIALKADTWDVRILDAGYHELVKRTVWVNGTSTNADKWTKIRDPFNQEATEPQPLDGNGKLLAPGSNPVFLRGVPSNYHLDEFATLLPF